MNDDAHVPDAELPSEEINETAPARKSKTWLFVLIAVVIVAIVVAGIVLVAGQGPDTTSQVRDIFIILMALLSLVIGVALIILIIQLAALINLLQNEIKPILKSTSDTVNTLKGTTSFLSDNLASPVIKINSSVAGLRRLIDLVGLFKK